MATLADTFLDMDEDVNVALADLENLNYDDLDSVSNLHKTQRYISIIQKVEEALQNGSEDDPDFEHEKKRGGRKVRKMNERYAITDMRKLANRMQFGVPEERDGLGEGYGMLGQAGSGTLRVSAGRSKLGANVAKKFKEKNYGSSGATSGLTSCLAFTPAQGIELTNPQAHAHQLL